jgi:hypothetical protein
MNCRDPLAGDGQGDERCEITVDEARTHGSPTNGTETRLARQPQ